MKPRLLVIAVALILIGGAGAWLLYNRQPIAALPAVDFRRGKGNVDLTASASENIDPSKRIRLAIGSLGLIDESKNGDLVDLVTADLSSAVGIEMVERRQLDAVLREMSLSLSGLVRAKDVIKVGQLLRADWFLLGTVSTAGTNRAIVARVVDAQTGIMRDVTVVDYGSNIAPLAKQLADFVQNCRQGATNARPREYLAIGTFRNVGVNDRQNDLPAELRSDLVGAYRNSRVTLLEREYVDTLLNEERLDLAGLVENSTGQVIPKLQPAFWMVTGYFQSYERTNLQIELQLEVQRIFGMGTNILVREPSREALAKDIKVEIDTAMRANISLLAPTTLSEARYQLAKGRKLAEMRNPSGTQIDIFELTTGMSFASSWDEQTFPLEQRNYEEAVKAFETVLLLEPNNGEAKMNLARCYRTYFIGKLEEALEIYRRLIQEGGQDPWHRAARGALTDSLIPMGAREKADYYETALRDSTNAGASEFLKAEAEKWRRDATIASGEGDNVQSLAEQRLFERLREADKHNLNISPGDLGLNDFLSAFGTNRETGVRALNQLEPKMKLTASNSIPVIVCALLIMQTATNTPLIGELEESMAWCLTHPAESQRISSGFWDAARYSVLDWAQSHSNYDLCVEIMENKIKATTDYDDAGSSRDTASLKEEDEMALAFSYLLAQRWRQALDEFGIWSNRPVYMGNSGPWGKAFSVVRTSRSASFCRKKLGLPEPTDPREFNFSETGINFRGGYRGDRGGYACGAFASASDGIWIARPGWLTLVGFDLKTNLQIQLPTDIFTSITALCVGSNSVWLGTDGGGLIEYDKAGAKCNLLTTKDGLMMDYVSALQVNGDALWIGYGLQVNGGLGKFDLKQRRLTSYGASLDSKENTNGTPPKSPVSAIAAGRNDDIWLIAVNRGIIHYRESAGSWEVLPNLWGACTLFSDSEKLFAGETLFNNGAGLGVHIMTLKDGKWHDVPAFAGFPNNRITTLCRDGKNVWTGGMGYVALVDPEEDNILRFCYIKWPRIDKIQVGGGFVWAQIAGDLYRASLTETR